MKGRHLSSRILLCIYQLLHYSWGTCGWRPETRKHWCRWVNFRVSPLDCPYTEGSSSIPANIQTHTTTLQISKQSPLSLYELMWWSEVWLYQYHGYYSSTHIATTVSAGHCHWIFVKEDLVLVSDDHGRRCSHSRIVSLVSRRWLMKSSAIVLTCSCFLRLVIWWWSRHSKLSFNKTKSLFDDLQTQY